MKLKLTTAALMAASAITPCFAQTAVGVGVARSDAAAMSGSRSTAIGGGNATGGNARASSNPTQNLTISGPPASTTSTINNEGTSTVRNVPSVFAPGLAAAGLETCLGSVSGGGSFVGTGFSFGTTVPDPGCAARLDARTLWSMGLKKAAIARLCLNPEINRAMPEVCGTYLPQPSGYYLSANANDYKGGPIMLVEGSTGRDRLCNNYDVSHQRCRAWDGAVMHHVAAKQQPHVAKQKMAASPAPAGAKEEDKSK